LLLLNKVLTADNLVKPGWPHSPMCKLCNGSPETGVHMFATCPYSGQVWSSVLGRVNLSASLSSSSNHLNLQDWWISVIDNLPSQLKDRWKSITLLTRWMLWKERNSRIFDNKEKRPTAAEKIFVELKEWSAKRVVKQLIPLGE
jgi:hypothetical protein